MGSLTSWDGFELHIGMGKITFRDAPESNYPQGFNAYILGWGRLDSRLSKCRLPNYLINKDF